MEFYKQVRDIIDMAQMLYVNSPISSNQTDLFEDSSIATRTVNDFFLDDAIELQDEEIVCKI